MCVNGSLIKGASASAGRWTREDIDLCRFLRSDLLLTSEVIGALLDRSCRAVQLKVGRSGIRGRGSNTNNGRGFRSQKVEHHTRNVPQDNPSTIAASKI